MDYESIQIRKKYDEATSRSIDEETGMVMVTLTSKDPVPKRNQHLLTIYLVSRRTIRDHDEQ